MSADAGAEARVAPDWRRRRLDIATFGAAGAAAGVLAKIADQIGVPALADLATAPTLWALVLAVISKLAPSPSAAAVRAAAFFVAMCLGYYAWTSWVLRFPGSGPLLAGWLGLALTVVPASAALVRWARDRSDLVAAAVIAGVAGLAANDPAVTQLWYAANGELPPDFPLRPMQAVVAITTAAVITLWVPSRWAVRAWALVLLVPATWAVGWMLDALGGGLIPG